MRERAATSIVLPIVGFLISILLVLGAVFLVTHKMLRGPELLIGVLGLGLIQAVVQLICFFFLGFESGPKWNLLTLIFMVIVVAIVVTGSIWIMINLDYNLMPNY